MEAEKYRIPLFDGTNFGNWKFRIKTLLTELELLELTENPYIERVEFLATDRSEEKLQKEKELKEYARNRHLEYVKDKNSTFEIWDLLNGNFKRKGMVSQLLVRKRLLTMKFNPGKDTLSSHFLAFD